MAGKDEEAKVPVFSVLKNGAILKNIFIVSKPPIPHHSSDEEILIVGRHPDCHIVLTHPSISRFHLQILSNPSFNHLSLTDLSSVHGTWVSHKRIQPGVQVELRQGDTLRLGASSRLYRLQWLPLSHAYQQEVVSKLPVENADVVCVDDSCFIGRNEISSPSIKLDEEEEEDLSEYGGQNTLNVVGGENEFPSFWGFGTESLSLFYPPQYSTDNSMEHQYVQLNCVTGGSELDKISESLSCDKKVEASRIVQVLQKDHGQGEISAVLSAGPCVRENFSSVVGDVLADTNCRQVEEDNPSLETNSVLLFNPDVKSSVVKDHRQTGEVCLLSEQVGYSDEKVEAVHSSAQIAVKTNVERFLSEDHGQTDYELCLSDRPFVLGNLSRLIHQVHGEINSQEDDGKDQSYEPTSLVNLDIENTNEFINLVDERRGDTEKRGPSPLDHHDKWDIKIISAGSLVEESTDSFSPEEVLSEIIHDNEIKTKVSRDISTVEGGTEKNDKMEVEVEVEIGTLDKENLSPNTLHLKSLKKKNELQDKLHNTQEEQEICTPVKENFIPDTLLLKSSKKKDKLELTDSDSYRSSSTKQDLTSNVSTEDLFNPIKHDQELTHLQQIQSVGPGAIARSLAMLEKESMRTKSGTERMTFQSPETSAFKNRGSEASVDVATKSCTSMARSRTKETVKCLLPNKFVLEGTVGWTIVADTNTLLNKESRKALQLLQGLKGTHLLIPRTVVREFNCLKQHGSLFRKETEACLALEWIQECMVKANWWIHVQSSLEDERLMAPTPPSSPQSVFSDNSWELTSGTRSFFSFVRRWSSIELVAPAAEDHILDWVLSLKKRSNERVVLLSNNITLKVKAMAEGLTCETAQEFRESLVNSSSERFMWTGSCPRGRTWSYLDDLVLVDKYNRCCQLNKSSRAKGLKLILLHNSFHGQIY